MDDDDFIERTPNYKRIRLTGAQLESENSVLASTSSPSVSSQKSINRKLVPVHREKNRFVSASSLLSKSPSPIIKLENMVPLKGDGAQNYFPTKRESKSVDRDRPREKNQKIDTFFSNSVKVCKTENYKQLLAVKTGSLNRDDRCDVIDLTEEDVSVDCEDFAAKMPIDINFRDKMKTELELLVEDIQFERDPFDLGRDDDSRGQAATAPQPSIASLPSEVLVHIFSCLPAEDLTACLQVCRKWCQIIQSPEIMRWKKLYARLRSSKFTIQRDVLVTFQIDLDNPTEYFPSIIRYFRGFKPFNSSDIHTIITRHKLYPHVLKLFQQKLPDCLNSDESCEPWSGLVAILILSRDLFTEVRPLFNARVLCGLREEMMECVFALASVLLTLCRKSPNGPWVRVHYRLVYLVHHLEKAGGVYLSDLKDKLDSGAGGQQSILRYGTDQTKIRLTHEQLRIARHNLSPGDVIKIKAFAGSGKTTTLVNFARFNPYKKFLLIVYNKAIQLYAQSVFPQNVICKTSHALAFKTDGVKYRRKLGNVNQRVLMGILPSREGTGNYFRRLGLTTETLDNFLASADQSVSLVHVPEMMKDDNSGQVFPISEHLRIIVHEDTEMVWSRMKDIHDKMVPMSHDGYLKVWQLSEPKFQDCDAILIDEAQDMTPPLLDVLSKQHHLPRVFVGDPYQQIYSFRGAINAMEYIQHTHEFSLTESFRFGFDIAMVAQTILQRYKGEREFLIGKNSPASIDGSKKGPVTVISRTNITVFRLALDECCIKRSSKFIHFIGGPEAVGISLLRDIHLLSIPENLRNGRTIKDRFISRFDTLGALCSFASKANDLELQGKCELVRQFGEELPAHLDTIMRWHTAKREAAEIIYTTAHKAKGLEFPVVILSEDFSDAPSEEVNILYVAATRAQRSLVLPHILAKLVLYSSGIAPILPQPRQSIRTCRLDWSHARHSVLNGRPGGKCLDPSVFSNDSHEVEEGEVPARKTNKETDPEGAFILYMAEVRVGLQGTLLGGYQLINKRNVEENHPIVRDKTIEVWQGLL